MRPVSERLGRQADFENAALIAYELEVVSRKVDRFGWTAGGKALTPYQKKAEDDIKQRLTDDWTAVLRPYRIDEVRRGISDCLERKPGKCPTEHEVKARIEARRRGAVDAAIPAPEPQEQLKEKLKWERMKQIMEEENCPREWMIGFMKESGDE